jgi:hypothetical protein
MPKSNIHSISRRNPKPGPDRDRRAVGERAPAGPFPAGMAGVPLGLDPDAARGSRPWGAWGGAASPDALQGGGTVTGQGNTPEELVRRSNFWRDNYNPMRGLTIAWLMARLEQAERGSLPEVQLLLRKAEKRFPVLKGFAEKLLAGVSALDGKVRVKEQLPAGATPAMAERQRRFLQDRYDLLRNFKTSLGQLALAEIRGLAVLQKHRYRQGRHAGAVEELYWLEPWCWARDGYYGDFYYNENSQLGVGLGSCQSILGEACRIGVAVVRDCADCVRELVDGPPELRGLHRIVRAAGCHCDHAAGTGAGQGGQIPGRGGRSGARSQRHAAGRRGRQIPVERHSWGKSVW